MIVAIDAGHGSNTPGKRTPDGYKEHWINVRTASYFDKAMKRCGIKTVKIGWNDENSKDDADISLSARQNAVKNSGAAGFYQLPCKRSWERFSVDYSRRC